MQGQIRVLFRDRRAKAFDLFPACDAWQRRPRVFVACIHDLLHEVGVVQRTDVKRSTDFQTALALCALPRGFHSRKLELHAVLFRSFHLAERLHEKALALHALVDDTRLGSVVLRLRWRGEDAHEHADVEVNRTRNQRHHFAAIPRGGRRYSVHNEPERHLVDITGLQRGTAISRKGRLWVISAQHRHVGRRDAQKAPVSNRLHRSVQERSACAIRIQVYDIVRLSA
mmetsp:Transcript_97797/g.276643  ORF Transcript_97797/g.276643 Transcript_97797/m.276643 type:complete len:227 (+) Transcript_97797:701-1381(+)